MIFILPILVALARPRYFLPNFASVAAGDEPVSRPCVPTSSGGEVCPQEELQGTP